MDPILVTLGTTHENGVFTVGFAERSGEGALLFSWSDVNDEQDALLGMDTYSISTHSGVTFYGGVESATMDDTDLELHLTVEAAEALGVSAQQLLRFTDRAEARAALAGLRRMRIATISP